MAETVYRVFNKNGDEVGRKPSKVSASNAATVGDSIREYVNGKRKRVWNVVRYTGDRCNTLEPA